MSAGYLIVETRADHPGRVRVHGSEALPEPKATSPETPSAPRVRFVARFGNLHVARMHAHGALRRCALDPEAGLYRTDPVTAVAAVDAIDLHHETVYLDPAIAGDPSLARETARRRRAHARVDRFFNGVGVAAILFLLLLALLGI